MKNVKEFAIRLGTVSFKEVDAKIYRIIERTLVNQAPMFLLRGSCTMPRELTTEIEKADAFASGTVYVNGASKWRFDAQDLENADAMEFETQRDLLIIGEALGAAWAMARHAFGIHWMGDAAGPTLVQN